MENKEDKIIDKVTEYGGAAASAAVGAGVGLLAAGPAGAVIGSLAGTLIENVVKKIGEEIKERKLSKSENKKVGSVYALASENIAQKLSAGKTLRSDDFFVESKDDRSTAEEILEGTLFAAQREAEEKKLPYYSRMYANIAFSTDVTRPMANQIIKIAEQLTYRQLLILNAIGTHQAIGKTYSLNAVWHGNLYIISVVFDKCIILDLENIYILICCWFTDFTFGVLSVLCINDFYIIATLESILIYIGYIFR